MEITVKQDVLRDAKVVKIHAKCSDMCSAELVDGEGNTIKDHDGYVPSFMPGKHYGDYVILDIDLESGKILNWSAPTRAALEEFVNLE